MLEALLIVYNSILMTQTIPSEWNEVVITLLYKNKGLHTDLENYRGIFLTLVASKVFERMLQNRMYDKLLNVSLYQAGSRPNRSPADNLFLLRSSIDYAIYLNRPIYITTYDLKQAFDVLWLQDCILSLDRLGVDRYLLQLIFHLNHQASVSVKTPFGSTDEFYANDIVKQGGVLGPILCSASLAEYCGRNPGIMMGGTSLSTLAYVDDLVDISMTPLDFVKAHDSALLFAKAKKVFYSASKCNSLVVNARSDSALPQLVIGNETVKKVASIIYLGDVFNNRGTNKDLIDDRIARGTKASSGITGFVRDHYFSIHTICVQLILYQFVLIPSMLFNSQAWSCLAKSDIQRLHVFQLRYLKKTLGVRKSTSNPFVHLELGVLPMEQEIHIRQLGFYHHIINLDENDPVKVVLMMMKAIPFPSWWSNIKSIAKSYTIDLDIAESVSKDNYFCYWSQGYPMDKLSLSPAGSWHMAFMACSGDHESILLSRQ